MIELAAARLTVLETLGEVLETPVDDLRANPVLASHAWDSLRSLEALTQLEVRLGVDFDLRTFNAARTVDDLVRLIVPGELAAHA
ncbi:acyl carrier protein [Streptantibioticus ferralitis]|uniref:Acyl carrier protein n=1 Tax=Streptantibioticus ferralitis TaxID=236510 RepID=A0ABT5YV57_9ACTN|nr:acyl carrier protein [Streptantibioticus ferralitis]MDF2255488.1 acyl carrier protein [Streptantibioticus ferralitis]